MIDLAAAETLAVILGKYLLLDRGNIWVYISLQGLLIFDIWFLIFTYIYLFDDADDDASVTAIL